MTLLYAMLLSAAPAPATVQPTAADADQRIKCRKIPVTGSLAGYTKECHTVAEWRKLDNAGSDTAREMQDKGLINSCGATEPGRC
ncbi:hypothetical protein OMW55_09120 [Sphingomonas sp. BN140010]|uniref:Uncharacterized protein n=1 Tax=Sphingomonas arvum TaxID=2992113 RepID=A0ABT3JFV8_9SPHN|nr:hypothetical protein [Sphingomonas sp. BN140010]MCW3797963.1 hypothetical protein [Sphingomonas sp. BN140010]